MKIIKSIIFVSVVLSMGFVANPIKAQNKSSKIATDSLYVYGVCNMCKDRIENAALIGGVKKVSWNKNTQYLTAIYKPAKVNMEKIEEEVVDAGHDTKNKKADDKKYQSLPDCCAYRSEDIKIH